MALDVEKWLDVDGPNAADLMLFQRNLHSGGSLGPILEAIENTSQMDDEEEELGFEIGEGVFPELAQSDINDFPGFGDLSDLADTMELSDELGLTEWVDKFTEKATVAVIVGYNVIKISLAVKAAVWLCEGTILKKTVVGTVTVLTAVALATSLHGLAVHFYIKRQKRLKSSQEL